MLEQAAESSARFQLLTYIALSMWPERTDVRIGVDRDGNQLPHSHWGPEVEQLKWCRPSGDDYGRLHYLIRSENLRLGDACDVVLAEMPAMHA